VGRTDRELTNGVEQRQGVSRVIRIVSPNVVLGHDPWRRSRLHPDHRHAVLIVTDPLVAARDPLFLPEQGLPPHPPEALLHWGGNEPNHLGSTTGFEVAAVAALSAHESQHESTLGIPAQGSEAHAQPVEAAQRVLAQMAAHGWLGGETLGESFHQVLV